MVDREKERDGMKGPPPVCSFSCIVLSILPPVGGVQMLMHYKFTRALNPTELIVCPQGILYDQYEIAIPVSSMVECMTGMMAVMYGEDIDSERLGTR
jgi:hypothetical protein